MSLTSDARVARNALEQRLNPGFRHSEPAVLLADACALLAFVASTVDSLAVRRDALDVALRAEHYLLETLSGLRVSKEDVIARFESLRTNHQGWPTEISGPAWERLRSTRLLRDISDVVCGGGDYWEAIDLALETEFDTPYPHTDAVNTLYHTVDGRDWSELQQLVTRLNSENASELTGILDRVEARDAERFAMVVWSLQDILDAVTGERDNATDVPEDTTWRTANVSREWVEEFIQGAGPVIADRMAERGREVLEEMLNEIGLPPPAP